MIVPSGNGSFPSRYAFIANSVSRTSLPTLQRSAGFASTWPGVAVTMARAIVCSREVLILRIQDRLVCARCIKTEALKRSNWTMVLAIRWDCLLLDLWSGLVLGFYVNGSSCRG